MYCGKCGAENAEVVDGAAAQGGALSVQDALQVALVTIDARPAGSTGVESGLDYKDCIPCQVDGSGVTVVAHARIWAAYRAEYLFDHPGQVDESVGEPYASLIDLGSEGQVSPSDVQDAAGRASDKVEAALPFVSTVTAHLESIVGPSVHVA